MPLITRQTDYALRALAHLVEADEFRSAGALAEECDAPEDFLRKIMQTLHHAGIVQSRQGPFGGYRLAREPAEVTLLEVVEAVQGPLMLNECFSAPGICSRAPGCAVRAQLADLQREFQDRMGEISLAHVVNQAPSGEATQT